MYTCPHDLLAKQMVSSNWMIFFTVKKFFFFSTAISCWQQELIHCFTLLQEELPDTTTFHNQMHARSDNTRSCVRSAFWCEMRNGILLWYSSDKISEIHGCFCQSLLKPFSISWVQMNLKWASLRTKVKYSDIVLNNSSPRSLLSCIFFSHWQ